MSVLVCVTGQTCCERLIVLGAQLAQTHGGPLVVMHVARVGANVMGYQNEAEALEYLLQVSVSHGADMFVKRSDDVIGTIEAEARARGAKVIVAGRAASYDDWDLLDELNKRLPDVQFEIRMQE